MIVNKAFKVRIYPTQEQEQKINQFLGSCRALYNMMLFERIQVYEKLKDNKRELYEYKYKTEKQYKEEFEWMKDVDSTALQSARIDLSKAYQNFFESLSGKRKGTKVGYPKFKKKKFGSSYRTVQNNVNIRIESNKKKIKLPKLGWIDFRDKRCSFPGTIKSATVSRTPTGKYFVSVLFEQEVEEKVYNPSPKDKVIGLDMSLQNFFVDNNGNSPAYERLYRKYEPIIAKLQRKQSKRVKFSKNWYKLQHKINLVYELIANKRKDFTQKLSTKLVQENDVIVIEHLSLKGMTQALKLGKSVMDLGYSSFVAQLKYKTELSGKLLIQADKWFASSKLCSVCGYKNSNLQLSDRQWICPNCGTDHNRDQNAGQNLQNFGLNQIGQTLPELTPVESVIDTSENESTLKQEAFEF